MDSCHIFNFLFGTKKATTELSKCFSSLSGSARDKRSARERGRGAAPCRASQSQPPSPLKQLQMKISNLVPGGSKLSAGHTESERARVRGTSCDAKCGTYRATLVKLKSQSDSEEDEEEEKAEIDERISLGEKSLLLQDPRADAERVVDKQHDENASTGTRSSLLVEPMPTCAKVGDVELHPSARQSQKERMEKLDCMNNNTILRFDCADTIAAKTRFNNRTDDDGFEEAHQVGDGVFITSSDPSYNPEEAFETPRRWQLDDCTQAFNERAETNPQSVAANPNDHGDQVSNDKRNAYVRSMVKSIESNGSFESDATITSQCQSEETASVPTKTYSFARPSAIATASYNKPVTFVKPMPPKTPPKTNKAKCLNLQLTLNKPYKIQHLFQDETFLAKFFNKLEPLDRCVAAQVCRKWRNVLYANQNYWRDLINVIDCTQLRRDQLVECILNTLQTSAKMNGGTNCRRQVAGGTNNGATTLQSGQKCSSNDQQTNADSAINESSQLHEQSGGRLCSNSMDPTASIVLNQIDQDDVWRIQELCNKFTAQKQQQQAQRNNHAAAAAASDTLAQQKQVAGGNEPAMTNLSSNSKSSSIPSQISSTFSSVSLSSLLLTPLSESNRIDSIKEKLYTSLDDRGFDALCLFGATDDDIEDLVAKIRPNSQRRIIVGRLNNCCISDRGLELFIKTFSRIEELELSGCNEISNSIELKPLANLKRLVITDCINIADGFAQKLCQLFPQLDELTLQAYHLTDASLEYLSLNADTSRLRKLELPNCKEIMNQSLVTIAEYFPELEALSISGSTKISDSGIEILAKQARHLQVLDLSWCSRISDASLDHIACNLSNSLTDLILDRNVNITDIGLGYLATMNRLRLLHIRWCPRISDIGLESILTITTLKYLSLAGLHQITARSLLCLIDTNLLEVELTNCPAVNKDLLMFLMDKMPNCNIIF